MARVRGASPCRHARRYCRPARRAYGDCRSPLDRLRTNRFEDRAMTVRVRYAPSPTGDPHVGNIRTALWTYLHARHHGGQFLVRIEDTDQSREVPGAVQRILDSLAWLGIEWDEGPDIGGPFAPYTQSERLPLYKAAAERLLASANAYRCFCTAERLDELRAQQRAQKQPPGY